MAIQNRRGSFGNFDKSKLLPGEWAVVTSGDPDATDGMSVYMCFNIGTVKRMATYEDMVDWVADNVAGDAVAQEVQQQVGTILTDCQQATADCIDATDDVQDATAACDTAAQNANTQALRAEQAADAIIEGAFSNVEIEFTQAQSRTNVVSNETLATLFGKVSKYFSDLGTGAFGNVVNGYSTGGATDVLSAGMGPTILNDLKSLTSMSSNFSDTYSMAPADANAVRSAESSTGTYTTITSPVSVSLDGSHTYLILIKARVSGTAAGSCTARLAYRDSSSSSYAVVNALGYTTFPVRSSFYSYGFLGTIISATGTDVTRQFVLQTHCSTSYTTPYASQLIVVDLGELIQEEQFN